MGKGPTHFFRWNGKEYAGITNRRPKLIDESSKLADLRTGDGYPGLLLDVASFVDDVKAGLRKLDANS